MKKVSFEEFYMPEFWRTWLSAKGRSPVPDYVALRLNEAAVAAVGRRLAPLLRAGDVVVLSGGLGAGKTFFTRALAGGLGLPDEVVSPTFVLAMEHESAKSRLSLYHFDVYRLTDENAFIEAGLDEYFDRGGVCVVEWAERIAALLPENSLLLRLQACEDEPERRDLLFYWPSERRSELNDLSDAVNSEEGAGPEADGAPGEKGNVK